MTAEGIAINNVVNVNTEPKNGFIPVTNIWWPHTIDDKNANYDADDADDY